MFFTLPLKEVTQYGIATLFPWFQVGVSGKDVVIVPNEQEAHIEQDSPDQPTPDEGEKGNQVLLNSCEPALLTSAAELPVFCVGLATVR